MDIQIPKDVTSLGTVLETKHKMVKVIGVVMDHMPPKASRGPDWMCTFSIADLSSNPTGVRVRYFAPEKSMPRITGTGDIVILLNVKVFNHNGADILISNRSTEWIVIDSNNIPENMPEGQIQLPSVSGPPASKTKNPTREEMAYAVHLCNCQDRKQFVKTAIPLPASDGAASVPSFGPRDKSSLLSDVKGNVNYDLVGQVVRTFGSENRFDLYITDYTDNGLFYKYETSEIGELGVNRDGDEDGYIPTGNNRKRWEGPLGQKTFAVSLFPPHASYAIAKKVKEGDFVLLKNVWVKFDRTGVARLEGAVHGDRDFPERVNVSIVTSKSDDRVKELLRRKKEYEKDMAKDEDSVSTNKKKSGNQKSKQKASDTNSSKSKRKRGRGQESDNSKEAEELDSAQDGGPATKRALTTKEQLKMYLEPNKHIQTQNDSQPTRLVSAINNTEQTHAWTTPSGKACVLPFQNICFRSTVRVLDFKPNKIEDFAVKQRISEYEDLSENEEDSDLDDVSVASEGSDYPDASQSQADADDEGRAKHRWTWRFALLLEDASSAAPKTSDDRIVVFVVEEDADFLLNQTACNLRRTPGALSKLREKLFILWGELEERKAKLAESVQHKQISEKEEGGAKKQDGAEDEVDGDAGPGKELTKAFHCCLKEYGVKNDGKWERKFRMFGTTIQ